MDPVSATASVIAIAGVAGKSCQALLSFFHGISEAQEDILQFCKTLQSLESTLQCIRSLCTDPNVRQHLTQNFTVCLKECFSELEAADTKCRKAQNLMQRGKMQSSWARLRWYLSAEHWLKKFFFHVQTYHTVFSLELSTLQTKLLVRSQPSNTPTKPGGHVQQQECRSQFSSGCDLINECGGPAEFYINGCGNSTSSGKVSQRSCLSVPTTANKTVLAHMEQIAPWTETGPRDKDGSVGTRLAQFLQSYSEPFAIRSQKMRNHKPLLGSLCYWYGPTVCKKWTENGEELFGLLPEWSAFGIRVTVRSPIFYPRTLSLGIFAQRETQRLESLSVRWSMSFPSIVPKKSPVMKSAREGDMKSIVAMFEARRAGYTDTTSDGTSLLHIAAGESHIELVNYLLECGADPNAIDDDGDTPLHFAIARSNDHNLSRKLIQRGADICSCNIEGKTPYHTFFRDTNKELLASYRAAADMTLTDDRGMQLLHYIAWSSKSTIADIQPFLAGDDSHKDVKDDEGRSVLFFAAERGNFAILDHILNLPNRPHLADTDVNGMSLMHYGVRSRRVQTIDVLFRHGCSTQTVDKNKQTALHHAVKRKNLEAIKRLLLLDGSRLLDKKDNHGRTPLDIALIANETAVIAYLRSLSPSLSDATDDLNKPLSNPEAKEIATLHQALTHWIYQEVPESGIWRIFFAVTVLAFLVCGSIQSLVGERGEFQLFDICS